MKLVKPPYPDSTGTGLYYCTQAAHRKVAIDLAVAALRELAAFDAMDEAMREWTIQAVIQGGLVREYHKWEVDTKSYFDLMHIRNRDSIPKWNKMDGSHVEKIEAQLALFSATRPASLTVIDETRHRVNDTKHEDSYLATLPDYEALASAVDEFWQEIESQETFTPPRGVSFLHCAPGDISILRRQTRHRTGFC
jgi:hypothetical protein